MEKTMPSSLLRSASASAAVATPMPRVTRLHLASVAPSRAPGAPGGRLLLQRRRTALPTAKAMPTATASPSNAAEHRPIPGEDLFMPTREQRTLAASFTIGGIGLHTGEYAYVRVRPAHAGDGRYFVLVPPGTNEKSYVPNMRAGGGVGREEREAAEAAAGAAAATTAAAAAAAAEVAARAAEEAELREDEGEGDGSPAASAAAAAAATASAAATAATRAASSWSSSSNSAADTSAPGSETSPRDARRYLAYLRALDSGFRGEYKEWLLSKEGGGDGELDEAAAAARGGLVASLLSTTPAARRRFDPSTPGAERPVPKSSTPASLCVDASPSNAAAWAAGRCLALMEGGRDGEGERGGSGGRVSGGNGSENGNDIENVVAFLNVGPLLAALEGMGVSNARIEVEAAAGPPGAAPLPRVFPRTRDETTNRVVKSREELEYEAGGGGPHPSLARTRVELPVTDGSALQWAAEIASVGLVAAVPSPTSSSSTPPPSPTSAPAPRTFISVSSRSQHGRGFVSLYPEAEQEAEGPPPCRVSVGVDAGPVAPVVGAQWLSWNPAASIGVGPMGGGHFRFSVAPARDWVPSSEYLLNLRLKHGLYKGGTVGTTLVANGSEWAECHRCRFVPDEPARNAVAAAVGALALLSSNGGVGIPRKAHVVAFNADASLWVDFVRAVEAEGSERVAVK